MTPPLALPPRKFVEQVVQVIEDGKRAGQGEQ